jgi:hypothetical protein
VICQSTKGRVGEQKAHFANSLLLFCYVRAPGPLIQVVAQGTREVGDVGAAMVSSVAGDVGKDAVSSDAIINNDTSTGTVSRNNKPKSKFLQDFLAQKRTVAPTPVPEPLCALNDVYLAEFSSTFVKTHGVKADAACDVSSECGEVPDSLQFRSVLFNYAYLIALCVYFM